MMKILGVKIDNLSLDEVLNKIEEFLNDGKQHYIVTPNPEFLVKAQKDEEFFKILNKADLSIPDGIGLVFASLLLGEKIKERVTGVDLMEAICKEAAKEKWPVFLFGAKENILQITKEKLAEKYLGLQIAGTYSPYFGFENDVQENQKIIELINELKASILFIALGASKQERWINENLKKMPSVKLAIGVGGAFDFISGRIKRAPKFMRVLGLEWFWRLIMQPWRIKRIFNAVIVFPLLILKECLINKDGP